MRRFLNLIVLLLVVAVALVFGKLNDGPVTVDFFVRSFDGWPLGFWLLLFFLGGMLIAGVVVYVQLWFSLRRRLREVERRATEDAKRSGSDGGTTRGALTASADREQAGTAE